MFCKQLKAVFIASKASETPTVSAGMWEDGLIELETKKGS